MDWRKSYDVWLEHVTDAEREELLRVTDEGELVDRFYKELEFGTAGLRGTMDLGTNRMNVYIIKRATHGLAQYLKTKKNAASRGVAIAYDSRHNSAEFAKAAALVLCANGIKTYLYSTLHSVPQLSFSVLELNCIAGIVITASHNPPAYNGYKVYNEFGGQLNPKDSLLVTEEINNVELFSVPSVNEREALTNGLLNYIASELDDIYYKKTEQLLLNRELIKNHGDQLTVVYTPLFGTGYVPVTTMLSRVGFKNLSVVSEESAPNGDFPTVKAPNPEDKNAFTLAFNLAHNIDADIVLATDPDADRLGVAIKRGMDYEVLTGNEIGILLMNYVLSMKHENESLKKNSIVVESIVSTPLAALIARSFGVRLLNVLTGFRFISEMIETCERTRMHEFVFGFEESYGFLVGNVSRDKDGICASMLIAEAALYYKLKGMTLADALEEIYKEHGYFDERVKSYTLTGIDGLNRIAGTMAALRIMGGSMLAGEKVRVFEDYKTGLRTMYLSSSIDEDIGLPTADMLRYILPDDSIICIRPSGTEPKLKIYISVRGKDKDDLKIKSDALCQKLFEFLNNMLNK
ncbi:MAG: phospho-sugar mutase [Clostridia bacterium]